MLSYCHFASLPPNPVSCGDWVDGVDFDLGQGAVRLRGRKARMAEHASKQTNFPSGAPCQFARASMRTGTGRVPDGTMAGARATPFGILFASRRERPRHRRGSARLSLNDR